MDNVNNCGSNGLDEDEAVVHRRYQEAVERLNDLQSNAATLSKAIALGRKQSANVENMRLRLKRCGISVEDLERLNAIHVTGTKGKGSTCAFAESLLRHRGFKTGFYSSPHLIEVRERIRINGRPLSKAKFVRYFWDVFNKLDSTKDQEDGCMPAYFSFLTLLGFHVFLTERVDVTLLEVGIGGRFDCTNVIESPVAAGISSLGHDHMSILGNTLEEIAWNKAGIMKESCCVVITSQGQPAEALPLLKAEAKKLNKTLSIAPPLGSYPLPPSGTLHLGIGGSAQHWNASLALQLTENWCRWRNGEDTLVAPFALDHVHLTALSSTRWFGRCSVIDRSASVRLHLDGAHTPESVAFCARWFESIAEWPRILVFNVLGERDARLLLEELKSLEFDYVIFCPNIVSATISKIPDDSKDVIKSLVTRSEQIDKCHKLLELWLEISSCPPSKASCVNSVEETLSFLEKANAYLPEPFASAARTDVLITGSLHLVGDFFALLSPEMNN